MWLWTMAGLVLLSTLSCNESGKSERKSHENRWKTLGQKGNLALESGFCWFFAIAVLFMRRQLGND